MSLVSKYFRRSVELERSVELVVIRDVFNPPVYDENGNPIFEIYRGSNVEKLLKQAFGNGGLSENVRLYHGNMLDEVTPKTPADVDKIMRLSGRIYAVVKPMGIGAYIAAVVVSTLVSLAMAFLMPQPVMPNQGNQPPSPNNALAARTNKQRLGGRIPDIYGTVWSVPDLIAVTYSAYIDHQEVEFSYMCIGRGRYHVDEAFDDTTPVKHVKGSSVLVYGPDASLDDAPSFVFGEQFSPFESEFARFAAKRYTSVNGQDLPYPDAYRTKELVFRSPNTIEVGDGFDGFFQVGDAIQIEGADSLESATGATETVGSDTVPATYDLSGSYEVSAVTSNTITLLDPELVNNDWQKLTANNDHTIAKSLTISKETTPLWQGWYYTEAKDHDGAFVNIVALNGLYFTEPDGDHKPITLYGEIESELVDAAGNAIAGTLVSQTFSVSSPAITRGDYAANVVRSTAAATINIENPHYTKGKRMRIRLARTTNELGVGNRNSEVQDIKLADFYSYRVMTPADAPKGVSTVYSKTLATEGALSLKERKLRLLVQRYVTDATSGLPKLSNRADDILRHIATDPKIGNLDISQVNMAQIKTEVDNIVSCFGTEKCAEFCGTFDNNNLSAEETIQVVAKAAFSQAKRQGNLVMIDFERSVPAPVAIFNSHNILPDTFTLSESLGIANDYDGVKVEYIDPTDDAVVTMSYPHDSITNPHEDKLIGVRNKIQAHMHMMRMYNKDQHAYKSCEFVAGDESNIVVRTNRITAADQLRADVQQGSVETIETIGSDIVLHTTDPVSIDESVAHTLFIQTINNGVEAIAVTARDDYSVILARLPSGEVSQYGVNSVPPVYQIVAESDAGRDDYLVSQKDPSEGMTNKLLCTNYDERYYQNDDDFKNGLIA